MGENQEVIGGRYRVLGRLGKGAMGVVFMAHDPVLDRKVAIKQMTAEIAQNEDLRQRFYVEARAAARLNHPHIITIHELQESGGEIYMVMEMLDGQPLASLIESTRGPLPLETALDLMAQVCDGLEYAHQNAIIHRDIKPANLFLTSSGVVKILDFGIARLGSLHLTATGAMVGTPDYMSPEQVRGEEVDRRTDVWAAGAVLYQMLCGSKPFEGRPLTKLLTAIMQSPHVPLQERAPLLPASVGDLVDRMLSKPRDQRPATAALVRDELRAILAREGKAPTSKVPEEYEATLVVADAPAAVPPSCATRVSVPADAGSAAVSPAPVPRAAVQPAPAAAAPPPPPVPVPAVQPAPEASAALGAAPAPRRSARRLVIAVVLVAAVAGGLAGWWRLRPESPSSPGSRPAPPRVEEAAGAEVKPAEPPSAGGQFSTPPVATPPSPGGAAVDAGQESAPTPTELAATPATKEVEEPSAESRPEAGGDTPTAAPRASPPVRRAPPPRTGVAPRPVPALPSADNGATRGELQSASPRKAEEAPEAKAPRVTQQLTRDTVAALAGRGGSSYGTPQGGATVAAVTRIDWVLDQYAAALSNRDAEALRQYRPQPSASESQLLAASSVSVKIERVSVQVSGSTATVRARRTIEATLASGAPLREQALVTFSLTRPATGWVINSVR